MNAVENELYQPWPIIRRPRLEWPDGARVAFWVGLNVEHFELGKLSTTFAARTAQFVPDPLNHGWRDFGLRVGIWRTMDLLDSLGIRASVMLNSDVCHAYPDVILEGNKRGWAWLVHGQNRSILEVDMGLEQERAYLTEVVNTIRTATSRQPKGWLGPAMTETFNTPRLLAELGLTYILDWCCDEQPFPINVPGFKMINVPYSAEINDLPAFVDRGYTAEQFSQMIVDQFDVLHQDGAATGRVMAVGLHPFITGQPFRHKHLARALAHVARQPDVWLATSDEIADWYFQNYLARLWPTSS